MKQNQEQQPSNGQPKQGISQSLQHVGPQYASSRQQQPGFYQKTINVMIYTGVEQQKEMFRDFPYEQTTDGDLLLHPMIESIRQKRFPVSNNLISYWSDTHKSFVFVSADPIPENYTIPAVDYNTEGYLQLKFRPQDTGSPQIKQARLNSLANVIVDNRGSDHPQPIPRGHLNFGNMPQPIQMTTVTLPSQVQDAPASRRDQAQRTPPQMRQDISAGPASHPKPSQQQQQQQQQQAQQQQSPPRDKAGAASCTAAGADEPHGKRTKERTIADIIEKVSLWRKLYNGVIREGTLVRYSLDDAAKKVDVSKKSLDDYLLQLRFGKKYSFDFQKHKGEKVGMLRTFVKAKKAEEFKSQGKTKGQKVSSLDKHKDGDDEGEGEDYDEEEDEQ